LGTIRSTVPVGRPLTTFAASSIGPESGGVTPLRRTSPTSPDELSTGEPPTHAAVA
jgi:hypothetical protein